MIDVAEAAQVSMTTASYVLNHRDVQIPAETRKRIWDAAKELGYQPNRFAQNLAHQRSGLIGVLTPINPSPFHAQLSGELSAKASALSYTLIFESIGDYDQREDAFEDAIHRLHQWRVDGLLLWCEGHAPRRTPECPAVLIGPWRSHFEGYPYVCVDLYEGARQAAEHLIALGHRQICFVGHRGSDPRWQALSDVADAAGLPPPSQLIEGDQPRALRDSVEALAKSADGPSAFLCISDVQALAVFRGLRNAGLRVPQDRSIVSCDESWVAENLDPALASVAVPFASMAESALLSLIETIATPGGAAVERVLSPRFNVRESTGKPAR